MLNLEPRPSSILFLAGDVSGDVHAAGLARALLADNPSRRLHALGGKRLRQIVNQSTGGQFLADTTNSSAIGLLSSIRIFFHCLALYQRLEAFLETNSVDLAILCDWGGFNARVLKRLHARGIPVLYYFPPGSWQRRGSRALGIVPYVTRIATPFKWSADRLNAAGARAEWVGHPSLENALSPLERGSIREMFRIRPNEKLVALLPGSRLSEIRVLAPRLAAAAARVRQSTPARFMAVVPAELVEEARLHFPDSVSIVSDRANELLLAADAAVVKTGTGTLEAVLAGTPQVAVYDVPLAGKLEWCLLWSWRWFPFIAMPNIVLQRAAVPEFIGPHCTAKKVADAVLHLLHDAAAREKMLADYAEIRQALGEGLPLSATERTAQIVEEMLSETAPRLRAEPIAA